jgi:hypothetical protein
VSAQSDPDRDQGYDQDGDVRTYAGGRQRAFTTAGEHGLFAFRLVDVSLATKDLLRTWIGVDVEVRDHRGQRFFGVYFDVGVGEKKEPTLYDVGIKLHTVTVVEGA